MLGLRNAVVMTVVWCCCAARANAQGSSAAVCKAQRPPVALPALPEASGLALGANSLLWMHNDSGAPELIAVEYTTLQDKC
jgi:hypothetical protein